ncbi:MAG TPA: hypothetical protein VIJ94_11450, partial [Caulobacteraceae bacterium]
MSLAGVRQLLMRAYEAGEAPDFGVGTQKKWFKAIDEMLIDGCLEPARFALTHLREREPELDWPGNVLELIDLMPADVTGSRFEDDRGKDVQIIPVAGSKAVVFVFCGRNHHMNLPLWLFDRWITRLDASIVYLRDFDVVHFMGGIRSLGDREATLVALRRIRDDLGADRVFCLGNSSGGYGALAYGLDLKAEAVLNFGGPVNLEPEFNTYLNRADAAETLRRRFPDLPLDLRAAYLAAPRRPRSMLVYGEQCWDDRLQGEHMAGVPQADLAPVQGLAGHGSIRELIRRGRFVALLDAFTGGDDAEAERSPMRLDRLG